MQLLSFSTYFTLKLIAKIMSPAEEANIQIQSPNFSLASVIKKMEYLQEILEVMRTDLSYNNFWKKTVEQAKNVHLEDPVLEDVNHQKN